MKKQYPVYESHNKAKCFKCGGVLVNRKEKTENKTGNGEYSGECTFCKHITWYDLVEVRQHLIDSLIDLDYIAMAEYITKFSYKYERYKLNAINLTQTYTSKFASQFADIINITKLRRLDLKPDNGVRIFIAKKLHQSKKNTKTRRELAIEILLKEYSQKAV